MTQPKSREGAPKTETPEKKSEAPPEDTPRDDDAVLETPESPTTVWDGEDLADLRKDDLKAEAAALDLPVSGTKVELAERIVEVVEAEHAEAEEARLEQEALHVSTSPVNSHAPVWLPHPPNSGGTPS